MSFYRSMFLIVAVLLSTSTALSQTGQLHGAVLDEETGESLIGVNVLLVGTKLGASSDLDGKFIVRDVPEGKYDVRISYVG